MTPSPLSIPSLASLIGVSDTAVRNWISAGLIPPPSTITATGEQAYPCSALPEIRKWYAVRASTRSTRGPGASARRSDARAWLRGEANDVD